MFAEFLAVAALQIGPLWQERGGRTALSPLWSTETREDVRTTDVVWPLFTSHRDWWRFCWFVHWQESPGTSAWQFDVLPFWFNGQTRAGDPYWGLFPLWGRHPDVLFLTDWEFALWPVWMRYKTPRPSENRWMTTTSLLFPFFHWRDDGSWGVWPLAGVGRRRESVHSYALWPLVTWATYRADRDTAGAGRSWMVWPLGGEVSRERETQALFLPPFFSYARTCSPVWSARGNSAPELRVRCPWPFVDCTFGARRDRFSFFPFYEHVRRKRYSDGVCDSRVTRWGWRLVELYEGRGGALEESRVFPFWLKNRTTFRLWPFWSTTAGDASGQVRVSRCLELFPIRWVDAVDRNWAPWWTFYEARSNPCYTDHSLFWGIFSWRTYAD